MDDRIPSKLRLGFDRIKTQDDIEFMSRCFDQDGHYPKGMSDCYVVGLNGDCGLSCPVFRRGDCGEPQELHPSITDKKTYVKFLEENHDG